MTDEEIPTHARGGGGFCGDGCGLHLEDGAVVIGEREEGFSGLPINGVECIGDASLIGCEEGASIDGGPIDQREPSPFGGPVDGEGPKDGGGRDENGGENQRDPRSEEVVGWGHGN